MILSNIIEMRYLNDLPSYIGLLEKKDKNSGCVMFTDVKSSSKLWQKHPDTMKKALFEHNTRISEIIGDSSSLDKSKEQIENKKDGKIVEGKNLLERRNKRKNRIFGKVVKTIGDAFMISFLPGKGDHPLLRAIQAAIAIQESLVEDPIYLSDDKQDRIRIRIGFCYGPMSKTKVKIQSNFVDDFYGDSVNTASRMESKVALPDGFAFCYLSNETLDKTVIQKIQKALKPYSNKIEIKDFVSEKTVNALAKKTKKDWLSLFREEFLSKIKDKDDFYKKNVTGDVLSKEFSDAAEEVIDSENDKQVKEIDRNDLPEPIELGKVENKRSGRLIPTAKSKDLPISKLHGVGPLSAYSVLIGDKKEG